MSQKDTSSATILSNNTPNVDVFYDSDYAGFILKSMNIRRFNDNKYCDVKIKVNDTEFPCHKAVLAEASSQLAKLLDLEESNGILEVNFIDDETMRSLLDFIYLGSISISANNARNVFLASELLQITSLQNAALKFLQTNIDVSNCLQLYILAQFYNCTDLENKTFSFASKNFDKLWHSNDILDLTQQQLISFLSNDEIRNVMDEKFIFFAAQRWFSEPPKKETSLLSVMETVRFNLLDSHFLQNCSELFPSLKLSPEVMELIAKAKLSTTDPKITSVEPKTTTMSNSLQKDSFVEVIVVGAVAEKGATCCYHPKTNQWFYGYENLYTTDIEAVTYMGNQLYAIRNEGNRRYLCQLNEMSSSWQEVKSEGMERMDIIYGLCSFDYHLYVIGSEAEMKKKISLQRFSFGSYKWVKDPTVIADVRPEEIAPAMVACNQNLYIAGGSYFCGRNIFVAEFEKYDLIWRKTITLTEMPCRRGRVGVCVFENFIYVIGGENTEAKSLKIVEKYDRLTDSWQTAKSMIIARNIPRVIVKDSKIYVFQGRDENNKVIHSVERYDPILNEWEIISETPDNMIARECFKLKIRKSFLTKIEK